MLGIKVKPSAIVIGGQKCGTTALYKYLSIHPSVAKTKVKEINFFNCNSRYERGLKFYHSHFPNRFPFNIGKIAIDITPGYLGTARVSSKRINSYNPNIKIIAILRNPTDRAYSAWQMYKNLFKVNSNWFYEWVKECDNQKKRSQFAKRQNRFGKNFKRDIEEEVEAIENNEIIEMPILRLGLYGYLMEFYYNVFDKEKILVISSKNLKNNTNEQLKIIANFLNLERFNWPKKSLNLQFTGNYNCHMKEEERKLLDQFYKESNKKLYSISGLNLDQ
jgi:hypothetical protein